MNRVENEFKAEMGYGVKGEFIFQKVNLEEQVTWESPVCQNDVLNSGLNRMGQGTWWNGVSVGVSGAAVDINQVALSNHFAYTALEQGTFVVQYEAAPIPRYRLTRRFRFNAGVFSGQNLAEVSISWATSSPTAYHSWNRALIRDAVGNPTTITMLSDEYLDVICNVYFYPDLEEKTSTIDLIDGSTQAVISSIATLTKPSNLGKYNPPGQYASSWPYTSIMGEVCLPNQNNTVRFSTADIGDQTGQAASFMSGGVDYNSGNATHSPYVINSFERNILVSMGLNAINGIIKSIKISSTLGSVQISLTPPITKLNTQVMTIPITIKWGRYVAP